MFRNVCHHLKLFFFGSWLQNIMQFCIWVSGNCALVLVSCRHQWRGSLGSWPGCMASLKTRPTSAWEFCFTFLAYYCTIYYIFMHVMYSVLCTMSYALCTIYVLCIVLHFCFKCWKVWLKLFFLYCCLGLALA